MELTVQLSFKQYSEADHGDGTVGQLLGCLILSIYLH